MNKKAMLATSPLSVFKAIESFNRDLGNHPELVKRLRTVRAFYVLEKSDGARLFGFSKFVGYEGMTARRYLDKELYALLDGGRTERHLSEDPGWFETVSLESAAYKEIYDDLVNWMEQYGKSPRDGVRINVLKPKFQSLAASQEGSDDSGDLVLDKSYIEGKLFPAFTTRHERSPAARQACIEFHGMSCAVCGFNFEDFYGEHGKGFIHVHHLMPLAKSDNQKAVDPAEDLRPVCPNCHYMLHRNEELLSPEELKSVLRRQRSNRRGHRTSGAGSGRNREV